MKIFRKHIILFILSLSILTITGCKKYFDLNENPNLATDPPINALLSTATHKAALNSYRFANINNYYAQYLASPGQDGATDTYQITDQTGAWDQVFYAMADLQDMINKAKSIGASDHEGVGQLLMAFNLNFATDTWGSVPFSDALFSNKSITPKYDSEEELYNTSLALINESITNLSKPQGSIVLDAKADLLHGGNRTKWLKTAYGLKARMLNKISKKSSYNPQAVLDALANSYTSNSDEAAMSVFAGVNPWAQLAIGNASALLDGWLSENFVNHMNGTKYGLFDPRLPKITDPTTFIRPGETTLAQPEYIGTKNGRGNRLPEKNTEHDENYISLNSTLTNRTSPLYILTYAELKFIEAEAALRLASPDRTRAYDAYLEGISANMNKLGVATADRDDYLAHSSVNVGASNLTLSLVFKEKYAALYLSPESWNDLRRFDYNYVGFEMPFNAALPTFIRRVAYPASERSKNGPNVPAQVSLDTPLWWDKP